MFCACGNLIHAADMNGKFSAWARILDWNAALVVIVSFWRAVIFPAG
jgi:hypothetical protein